MFFQSHVTNEICYLSITTRSMAIKLGKVLVSLRSFQAKSHNPLNRQSHEVTGQIKYAISVLPKGLWPLNTANWWLAMRNFHPQSHNPLKTWSFVSQKEGFVYHNAWSHQRKQHGDKGEGLLTKKSHGHINKWLCKVTWKI